MNIPQLPVYNNEPSTAVVPTESPGGLVGVSLKSLQTNDNATDKMFGMVAQSSQFLPRLQLFTTHSEEVKAGKVELINHYCLVVGKDKITVLGKQVPILPLAWRPKAFQILPDAYITKYDPQDPAFKEIAMKADNVQNSKCMYGPEFLVWIPSVKKFAGFFMSSKSARIEAPNLKEKLDAEVAALLDSTFIQTKKFSWQAPMVKGYSTPFEVPPPEEIVEQVNRFNHPPKDEVEAVGTTEADNRPR